MPSPVTAGGGGASVDGLAGVGCLVTARCGVRAGLGQRRRCVAGGRVRRRRRGLRLARRLGFGGDLALPLAPLRGERSLHAFVMQALLLDLLEPYDLLLGPSLEVLVLLAGVLGLALLVFQPGPCLVELATRLLVLVERHRRRIRGDGEQHVGRGGVVRPLDAGQERVLSDPGVHELANRHLLEIGAEGGDLGFESRQFLVGRVDLDGELIDARLGVEHRLRGGIRPITGGLDLACRTLGSTVGVLGVECPDRHAPERRGDGRDRDERRGNTPRALDLDLDFNITVRL